MDTAPDAATPLSRTISRPGCRQAPNWPATRREAEAVAASGSPPGYDYETLGDILVEAFGGLHEEGTQA